MTTVTTRLVAHWHQPDEAPSENGDPVNLSLSIVGLYWLAASLATTAAWTITATLIKRAARRSYRCHCGTC